MEQRIKIGILIVGVVVLAGVAAWRFWPAPEEPLLPVEDRDSYLERELVRLRDANPEDLPDSERRIKSALGSDADTHALLQEFLTELARRHREANQKHMATLPPAPGVPEGENGWEALVSAGDFARVIEEENPYFGLTFASPEEAAEFLRTSDSLPSRIRAALAADHITAPEDSDDLDAITTSSTVSRMAVLRVSALLETGDRAGAFEEARSLLLLNSRTNVGHSLIFELMRSLVWQLLFDDLLMKVSWQAEELEELIRVARPPAFNLAELVEAEIRYLLKQGWNAPPEPELSGWALDELLDEHGYLPLNELIGASIESSERVLESRRALAEWCKANPGDVLDPELFRRVEARLEESDRPTFSGALRDLAQRRAFQLAAGLKLRWLKEDRGPDLQLDARGIASHADVMLLEQAGAEYHIKLKADHPLAAYSKTDLILAKIPLAAYD